MCEYVSIYIYKRVSIRVYALMCVCVCVCACARFCMSKVRSSAILLREQFLNVSLAPAGLNILVLEDYGKNVRENLRY